MGTHAGLLRLAEDLVAQNTVSHPSIKEEDHSTRTIVTDVVVPYLRKHGFTIRELPYWVSYKEGKKPPLPSRKPLEGWVEKVNLIAQKGKGEPQLVLSGHMDTVSANPVARAGDVSTTAPLRIGSRFSFVEFLFAGSIDEVELFNRVLAPEEIAALFNAGSAGKC